MIEIKVTPNRPDALGVRGIARDLAARGLGKLKPLEIPEIKGAFASPITVQIDDVGKVVEAAPLKATEAAEIPF